MTPLCSNHALEKYDKDLSKSSSQFPFQHLGLEELRMIDAIYQNLCLNYNGNTSHKPPCTYKESQVSYHMHMGTLTQSL